MSFKTTVEADVKNTFLNGDEFAETRTIKYAGVTYADIPVSIQDMVEAHTRSTSTMATRMISHHEEIEGLYQITAVVYIALTDMNGVVPKQMSRIEISDRDVPTFFNEYYIASSKAENGMLKIVLEEFDE